MVPHKGLFYCNIHTQRTEECERTASLNTLTCREVHSCLPQNTVFLDTNTWCRQIFLENNISLTLISINNNTPSAPRLKGGRWSGNTLFLLNFTNVIFQFWNTVSSISFNFVVLGRRQKAQTWISLNMEKMIFSVCTVRYHKRWERVSVDTLLLMDHNYILIIKWGKKITFHIIINCKMSVWHIQSEREQLRLITATECIRSVIQKIQVGF